MKKFLLLLSIFISTSIFLYAQENADDLFSIGRDAFSSKAYNRAIESFDSFLGIYPDDARADGVNYMRSVSYFYLKKYIDAIDSFKLFETQFSDSAYISRVYYWLGLCSYALRDYEQAAISFQKQTNYKSERFFVGRSYLYLGESYEKASMPDQAIEAYRQGIIHGGEEKIVSQSRLKLGILFYNSGNYQDASEQFAEIINTSIDTDLVSDSQFYIGESLYHLGDLKDAASKLQFYLFMNSNNKYREAAIFRLGDIYQSLGKASEAIKYLQLLLNDYPEGKYYLDGLRVLGRTWKSEGDMDKTAEIYKEIITLSDDRMEIQEYNFELALSNLDRDDVMKAVPYLKESALGPDEEKEKMSLYYLGQILMEEGLSEEGSTYLYQLSTKFHGTEVADDASLTLTDYLVDQGDKHRLALFIGSQLDRDSKYLDKFLFIKAGLELEEGNLEESIASYDRIIDQFPESVYLSTAYHEKARILRDKGESDLALNLFDSAMESTEEENDQRLILVEKALLLYDLERMEEADLAFTILLEEDVDFDRKGEILFRQGLLAFEERSYNNAADYFRRSAESSIGELAVEALFYMGKSHFHLLSYKTSERIYTDLADKLSSTSDRKTEAMKMIAMSIFLQQDWNRALQYSDLMVTSLGVYTEEIKLIKLLSLLALNRTEAFEKELKGDDLITKILFQVYKVDIASALLIFRSLLSAYPDDTAESLAVLLIIDLMYIVSDESWIKETYQNISYLITDEVLKIGFQQSYEMNK